MEQEFYSIKDLEKLTGIKAHTIRIWEKRYSLLEPNRTDSNIRYYDVDDLKKLMNIATLNKNGLKISRIAEFKDAEIRQKTLELSNRNNDAENKIQDLIKAMFYFDVYVFEKIFTALYLNIGFENTFSSVILPFTSRVRVLWQTKTVTFAHVKFAENVIKRKIMVKIDSLLTSFNDKSKTYTLFLPEGENNEINLLYAHYLLKKYNRNVRFVGASIPLKNITDTNILNQSEYFVTYFESIKCLNKVEESVNKIAKEFSNSRFLIIGYQMDLYKKELPPNVKLINTFDMFIDRFDNF